MSTFSEPNTSIELWAASKVIGRECATVNKEFLLCKKHEGTSLTACSKKGEIAQACASDVVNTLKKKYPVEFNALAKCVDHNDYRFHDCKKEDEALRACWNKDMKP